MAFDAYLDLPEIPGEATRAEYEGQIKLESFGYGASNSSSIGTGGGGAGTSRSSVTSLHVSKNADQSSPLFFQGCCQLMHYPTATITVVKSGGGEDVPYIIIILTDVVISSYHQSGGGSAESVHEEIDLSFGKIEITYTAQSDTGAQSSPTVALWDVRTATA